MVLTEIHKAILKGQICPYCSSPTRRTTEVEIYGKHFSGRDIIVCKNYPLCDSYVGCHKSGEPLGRLANKKLREAKINAHDKFDRLWKGKLVTRSQAYKMLSEFLQIPPDYTHIGMFKLSTLKKVESWSIDKYKELS